MRFAAALILWQSALISSFVVIPQTTTRLSSVNTAYLQKTTSNNAGLFMATKEEEDAAAAGDEPETERTSFADAGNALIDEEDDEKMESQMGDFDSTGSQTDNIDRMRAAIRARAQDLGVEKSKVSQQYIEDAENRAAQAQGEGRPVQGQLDLSQISSGNEPGGKRKEKWDESLPNMMYDPADDLTDEEQAEADFVGELPIFEQVVTEVKASKWPNFATVIREVVVMFVVVVATGGLIIGWDGALRNFYTGLGMIPTPEDIPGQLDDLDLPEGFTNNMNEDDLAKITDEMNQASKSPAVSKSPSINALLKSNDPDL